MTGSLTGTIKGGIVTNSIVEISVDNVRKLGNLIIKKSVEGGVTESEANGTLTFVVQRLDESGKIIGYLDRNGKQLSKDEEDKAILTVSDFETINKDDNNHIIYIEKTFNKIEPGNYKVVETNAEIEGYRFEDLKSVTETATITINQYNDGEAKLKDVYTEIGDLDITKTVEGGVTEEEAKGALKFVVERLDKDGNVIGYLDADGKEQKEKVELTVSDFDKINKDASGHITSIEKNFKDIEAGTYKVIETNTAIEGYRFEKTDSVTETETITVNNDKAAAADLKDVYTAIGNLVITKTVSGGVTREEAEGALKFEVRKLDESGKVIGYLDKDGNVVKNAVQLTIGDGFVTTDGGKTYTKTFTGIETGSYKVVETNAVIDGYFFEESQSVTETATTVSKNTSAAADLKDVYVKKIKISKVDVTNQKEIAGAHIVILDSKGNVVEEWDSTTTPHEVKKLTPGETYTLRETVAPKGYSVTADTTFVLNDDGTVKYSGNTRTSDGVLLVEDAKAPAGTGSVKVTKYTLKNNGAFKVVSQTFYTALFSDSALTKRVSDIKPIVLQNAYTTEVTFTNLPFGTYYVAETDATGKPYTKSATVTNVSITNGTAQISGVNPTANAIIKNTVAEGVLGAYVSVNLTVNKKVVGTNGKANKVKDTFYFALYSDKNFTNQIRGTSIQKVTLNNASSGSAVFRDLPYTDEIYVAEVDKNGKLVSGKKGFSYSVSYSGNGLTYARADGGVITVTNKGGDKAGANRDKDQQGDQGAAGAQRNAVRTGDQSPILPLMITMLIAAAAVIFLLFTRRRMKKH